MSLACEIIFGCSVASSTEAASRSRSFRSIAVVTTCTAACRRSDDHSFSVTLSHGKASMVIKNSIDRCLLHEQTASCHQFCRRDELHGKPNGIAQRAHQLDEDVRKAWLVQLCEPPHHLAHLRRHVTIHKGCWSLARLGAALREERMQLLTTQSVSKSRAELARECAG